MASFNTLEDIAPLVEEVLGRGCWIDRDLGWVTCPGCGRHTANSSLNDCQVFPNPGRSPRLYCFHQSCAGDVADANRKLGSAVLRKQTDDILNGIKPTFAQKVAAGERVQLTAKAGAAKERILSEHGWSIQEMVSASPVAPAKNPAAHWHQLLELFTDDDVIWGGSLYDSGRPEHVRCFKTKREWMEHGLIPGQYTCPSAFKPGSWSRSKSMVENRRYLIVESDILTKDQTAAIFRWLKNGVGLHLGAVVDTGNKSIHSWFQIPDADLLAKLEIILPALGCDGSMFAPSQVCRLPGAVRDGGAYQRLLYLDLPGQNRPVDLDNIIPLPRFYYDGVNRTWHLPGDGEWYGCGQQDVTRHLKEAGYSAEAGTFGLSDLERALNRIQRKQRVDYSGALAGYDAGHYIMSGHPVLVTSSPKLMIPVPGEFPTLSNFFNTMLGEEQLRYFYGWLHVSLTMFYRKKWKQGQVVAFAGPPNAGKSFIQTLLTEMFGGREADPYKFMTDRTTFNGNLFGAEHLKVEDSAESVDFRVRRHLGAFCKQVAANQSADCERKHCDSVTMTPRWRLTFSLNDEPERLQVLPPIDSDIADKIMLFLVKRYPVPGDEAEKEAFRERLSREMPAFIHHLLNWVIPPALSCSRMGIKAYHHPELLAALERLTPERQLLELIDDEIFRGSATGSWSGMARDLRNKLTDKDSSCCREAEKILPTASVCGRYLGRLKLSVPERVESEIREKTEYWTVYAPAGKPKPAPRLSLRERIPNCPSTFMGVASDVPLDNREFDTLRFKAKMAGVSF